MNQPIYLDYNATTPADPRVVEQMLPYFCEVFGNPSSKNHSYGWAAAEAIQKSRKQAAQLLNCQPAEIFWTSGATESNNMTLVGAAKFFRKKQQAVHFITSQVEHKSVLDVMASLENEGVEVTYLKPNVFGGIHPDDVRNALKPETRLVSINMGQNEIGTLNPIKEIAQFTSKKGVLLHVDAAQTFGKIPIDLLDLPIDLLSASGHKMYAPKGVGLLFKRKGIELETLFCGGKQESGFRPGTQNVPGIVGMGKACELCHEEMPSENERLKALQNHLIQKVLAQSPNVRLNGHPTERLHSNISFSFRGISPEAFELYLCDLATSSGSACSTGEPSYVLKAIGHDDELARATLRLGLGRFTTQQDIDIATEALLRMLTKAESLSSVV